MMSIIWVLFTIGVWGITVFLVKWENFKRLWIAGIIGMVLVTMIDSPLAQGGLYTFHHPGIQVFQLPLFYILGLFGGGIFLVHFYPWGNPKKGFLFFIIANAIFLPIEFLMVVLGMFEHVQWRFLYSFFINITGFLLTIYTYMVVQHLLGNKKYTL